ncbi:16S rRNA (adenine(1518)-N(6)/adenine(1519)-N(6))-dimethyltransferase RsmA [Marinivivus vitaminiproducens]|uniref:16S rRNA (adenine(1518)-N(6)/adenine(1519)-N(6))- dimethyltransferase RsmA n=1 Tax=Marinivivus vitaminiproducens TaxID=3035935 RepID=UPI0027A62924|nr:16S rRNA (adenine(1518)-N(6)/adenine(1519)-N(6))-dimethyltransferase RsmA [Geminicoccaceae bacterium SCSIO 64248]
MSALDALPPLRDVIRRHGLSADKAFSQNYLLDGNLLARIARAAGPLDGRHVLEVGPGPGGLTRALLASGAKVTAVERDRRFYPALDELAAAADGRLSILQDDALAIDEARLDGPLTVVANLPYTIATVLWFKWLDRLDLFEGFTLLFQREVAERLTARPGGKAYGRLAVKSQRLARVHRLFDIPARAFVPPPKVTSTLIGAVPLPAPLCEADAHALDRVLTAAFGQRRKMLRVSLRALGFDPAAMMERAGVAPTERPESLDIAAFCRLAGALQAMTAAS